jgi:ADP-ribose pyrophosphatase YjhB (NUDIX family)
MSEEIKYREGVAVIVLREENGPTGGAIYKILLGERAGSHGAGTWAFPGGAIDEGEDYFMTALRELEEETGLLGRPISEAGFVENVMADGGPWRTYYVYVEAAGEPTLREPKKNKGWRWFALDNLPSPLFAPVVKYFAEGGLQRIYNLGLSQSRRQKTSGTPSD